MKKRLLILSIIAMPALAFCQQELVINGTTAVQIVENGGTFATPIYIEIGNGLSTGIPPVIGSLGWIVSENEFNKVKWDIGTNTGTYIIPFGYKALYSIPLTTKITVGGSAGGSILYSTWHTQTDNWTGVPANTNGHPSDVTNMNSSNGLGSPSSTDDSYYVVDRFWTIDPYWTAYKYTTPPTLNPITFSYLSSASSASEVTTGAGNNVFTENTLKAQRFDTITQDWQGSGWLSGTDVPGGTVGTVTTNSVVSGTNFFRSWTLSSSTDPLPIKLLYFNCSPTPNGFQLNWETGSEQNNKYFTIERSNDGINFSTIATNIPGAGNSVITKSYSYDDINPPKGFNYYRLSQTDDYGNTVQDNISECESAGDSVLIYPNPSSGMITIQLPKQATSNPTIISLYDLLGRQVYTQTVQNQQAVNINVANLASSIYIANIITSEKISNIKLIVKKN